MRIVRKDLEWVLENGRYLHSLPVSASMETLDGCIGGVLDGAVVRYGDRVLIACYRYDGVVSAVYEFVDDDHNCDSRLNLVWMDSKMQEDAGHALEAGMVWSQNH